MDIENIRTALLVTLSVLLVLVLFQRFRRRVLANDLPAPLHAELISLKVAYHPARLLVTVHVPQPQRLATALVHADGLPLHPWPDQSVFAGTHHLERPLPELEPGSYHFELRTATQRTVRRFRHQP